MLEEYVYVFGVKEWSIQPYILLLTVHVRYCFEMPHEPSKDHFLLLAILVPTQTFTVARLRVLSIKPSLA